jgi:hypothetical protein
VLVAAGDLGEGKKANDDSGWWGILAEINQATYVGPLILEMRQWNCIGGES